MFCVKDEMEFSFKSLKILFHEHFWQSVLQDFILSDSNQNVYIFVL